MPKTNDIHTRVLADTTVKLMQKEIPSLDLKLVPYDADNAACEITRVACPGRFPHPSYACFFVEGFGGLFITETAGS
jgi:hypothetical protein